MDLRTHKPKHRHFIAVPILLMGFGFLYGIVRTFATNELPSSFVHIQAEERQIVSGAAGLRVQLEAGTDATFSLKEPTFTLTRGSSIVSTPSMTFINLGSSGSLSVVGGSLFLSIGDDRTTTIVPLDAAVLLRTGSASILVPAYSSFVVGSDQKTSLTSLSMPWLSEMKDQITALTNTQCEALTCTMLPIVDCLPQDCPLRAIATSLQRRATLDTLASLSEDSDIQAVLSLHLLLSPENAVIDTPYLYSLLQQPSLTGLSRTILSLSLARNIPLDDAMMEMLSTDIRKMKSMEGEERESLHTLLLSAADLASERGLVDIQSGLEELAASWGSTGK